ncbi:hypothetical protein [Pseudomonas sp. DSP3-2-2]|uniref:hypothetical protein n=1 Tax=unclassified Pseudomonas TaxID=196821 RepID=UPI003CEC3ADD
MVDDDKSAMSRQFSDPLDFLLAVMNDPTADGGDRLEAATVLMPYFHESLNDPEDDELDE